MQQVWHNSKNNNREYICHDNQEVAVLARELGVYDHLIHTKDPDKANNIAITASESDCGEDKLDIYIFIYIREHEDPAQTGLLCFKYKGADKKDGLSTPWVQETLKYFDANEGMAKTFNKEQMKYFQGTLVLQNTSENTLTDKWRDIIYGETKID